MVRELEELRRSREELAHIVESGPIITVRGTTDGFRITGMSPNMEHVLGIRPEDLTGTQWHRFVHPDDIERVWAELSRTLTENEVEFELRLRGTDGDYRWLRVFLHTAPVADGSEAREVIGWAWDETAQKAAEERYRLLAETVSDAAFVYSVVDGRMVADWITGAFERITTYAPGELLSGELFSPLAHPDDVPIVEEAERIVLEGVSHSFEFRILTKAGETRWLRIYATPLRDPVTSEVASVYGAAQDVTERKRTELALAESEEHLRTVLATATDAYIAIDGDGVITEWNRQAEQILGWKREEALGRLLHKTVIPERYRSAHLAGMAHFQETGEGPVLNRRLELEALHRDGHGVPVEITIWPLARGGTVYCHALLHDISERKRAEQALRESEESLRRLIESSPAAIVGVDLDGNVTMWNPAAEAMFGWSHDEVLGVHNPLVPPDLERDFAAALGRLARGKTITDIETQRLRKDGRRIDVVLSSAPLRDRNRRTIGAVSVLADVSERKRLEAELAQAQKMTAIGRLAGGVAQDFNNLLTTIMGRVQLLTDDAASPTEVIENAEAIMETSQRAAGLTEQLLTFSRHRQPDATVLDLDEVVGSMRDMLSRLIGEDVTFEVRASPEPLFVRAPRSQLEQVLLNLVLNARDAMPDGGRLRVQTAVEHDVAEPGGLPDWVVLRVEDTGEGMDAETRERIFEPFFTTRAAAVGLGLAVVYGIVTGNGGTISVISAPIEGSVVEIRLPRAAPEREVTRVEPPRPAARGTGTVLLVEDDSALRSVVQRVLERQGYEAIAAGDGVEALQLMGALSQPVDLLVTDMVMPKMSGTALAKQLRARWPRLPVVYMSGYSEVAPEGTDGPGAASCYVRKPFTAAQLLEAVERVLRTRAEPSR